MNSPGTSRVVAAAQIVSPDRARAQLERILASPSFATARAASRFLRYVVEETLAGRGDQIKEYVVGVAVFDRGEGYDPRADGVVRVEATRLRNRLRDYYRSDGGTDAVLIDLPKGSYVPVFQCLPGTEPAVLPSPALIRSRMAWVGVGVGVGLLILLGVLWWRRIEKRPLSPVESLAVLPLENVSGDSSQDYLADGLTDSLIAELGKMRKLRVISHAAVARYKRSGAPLPAIAGELKVDALVQGSVLRTGNRVRITGRLIHGNSLRPLWSQSYEHDVRDLPALPKELARSIAGSLRVDLTPGDQKELEDIRRISPEAYDAYLRGRFHSQHQNKDENETAILDLEHAVALDPHFASAYAELAQAYVWKFYLFAPTEKQWEEKAFVAAERALSLDPDSAEAHLARGRLLWTPANHFPHERAILEYRRALELNPNLDEARNQLALIYCHIGYFDQSLEESQKAVQTNPNNDLAVYRIGQTLVFQQKYEPALSVLRGIPEKVNPALVGYQTAWALFNLGRTDEASAKVAQLLKDYPQDSGGVFTAVQAVIAASTGNERQAEAEIKLAVQKGRGFGHFHHTAYLIAAAYAHLHKPELAVRWLEATAADGFPCYPLFERDPNLKDIRENSRFVSFMATLKQQWLGYGRLF